MGTKSITGRVTFLKVNGNDDPNTSILVQAHIAGNPAVTVVSTAGNTTAALEAWAALMLKAYLDWRVHGLKREVTVEYDDRTSEIVNATFPPDA